MPLEALSCKTLGKNDKELAAGGYRKLNSRHWGALFFIITLAGLVFGQTFELDQQKGTGAPKAKPEQKEQGQKNQSQSNSQSNKDQQKTGDSATPSLGWGSSIEVAR